MALCRGGKLFHATVWDFKGCFPSELNNLPPTPHSPPQVKILFKVKLGGGERSFRVIWENCQGFCSFSKLLLENGKLNHFVLKNNESVYLTHCQGLFRSHSEVKFLWNRNNYTNHFDSEITAYSNSIWNQQCFPINSSMQHVCMSLPCCLCLRAHHIPVPLYWSNFPEILLSALISVVWVWKLMALDGRSI